MGKELVLESKRAILRAFRGEDFADLEVLMSDEEAMKFTGFKEAQTKDKIKECLGKWSKDGSKIPGVFCAEEKETKQFIGWFMLKDTGHGLPEIGFMLAKQQWGKGFATEIAEAMIKFSFENLDYNKIIATVVETNFPSKSVLKKLGMKPSQIDVDTDLDRKILCYEIIKPSF